MPRFECATRAIRAFERAGWTVDRQKGSHVMMKKPGALRPLVVPDHGKDLADGTLRSNLRTAGLTIEEFVALL